MDQIFKMTVCKCILLIIVALSSIHGIHTETQVTLTSETSISNPVTISCNYDGLIAEDNLAWKYTNSTDVVSILNANTLTVNLTSSTEVGLYTCSVNNMDVERINVVFISSPVIKNTKKSVTFNDGDTERKLICTCEGSYPPVKFEWRRRDEDASEDVFDVLNSTLDPNINIMETAESSTILFHNLTFSLQAYYECYVINSAGNDTVEVLIRVKDRLAALWPFLGIVAEVVILVVLIFAYEQRSKKASKVAVPDVDDDAEKPLKNDSENGTELRNRVPNNNYK